MTPTIPGFQFIKQCIQYLDSHPHKPSFIPIILMMSQIPSDLHGVVTKLNTQQPRIFYNSIKIWIVLELSTEDVQFQVFLILVLVFLFDIKCRLNQI